MTARRTVFLSDDGVVLSATLRALEELGVLGPSLAREASLAELFPEVRPQGFGYLRAGLRSLAGQGWLAEGPALTPEATVLGWTEAGRRAAHHHHHYIALGSFLAGFVETDADAWSRPWPPQREAELLVLVDACRRRWDLDAGSAAEREEIVPHLDGALLVPALLALHGQGRLGGEAPDLGGDEIGRGIGLLLGELGWLDAAGRWTESGRGGRDYAIHFGIVGSYLPLLARLPELYRGQLTVSGEATDGREWHVNRDLNVIASGAAHRRYFSDADEVFLEIFDSEPLEEQPRFVADMGCGDGSWLIHLQGLIGERTLRGRHLADHPLRMVGIDLSPRAIESARRNLAAAEVPALLVSGDIGDPESLAATLAQQGLAMEDGLHIRSFLDHDRAFRGEGSELEVPGLATGAYVDRDGSPLDAASVERDLVMHLRRWAPHVRRHGLVVLEAHCVAPDVARRHLGTLHSVAFDAYHACSHQYLVEHSVFGECSRRAGLERVAGSPERQYPSSRPFVAVSLNRLVGSGAEAPFPARAEGEPSPHTWRPGPGADLEDGEALHRLLFEGGDLRHPRAWCAAATAQVVAGTLEVVEARLRTATAGDVIRVLDYGTGTGLAAIEFLKACRQRNVETRLERCGATLELHLVDLPSGWFARGFELLGDRAWTRFHSLLGPDGRFRPLDEVLGGEKMDAVMASMVFHLIPPPALREAAAELAGVLTPAGRLLWSSPDLGPTGPDAVLFHDPNRALRALWLQRHGSGLDPTVRSRGQERADRRILPRARSAGEVVEALAGQLSGELATPVFEITDEEVLDALLVPSNQAEYLSEIEDRDLRERTIAELMLGEVLPAMSDSGAATGRGLGVRWALGDFGRSEERPGTVAG